MEKLTNDQNHIIILVQGQNDKNFSLETKTILEWLLSAYKKQEINLLHSLLNLYSMIMITKQ